MVGSAFQITPKYLSLLILLGCFIALGCENTSTLEEEQPGTPEIAPAIEQDHGNVPVDIYLDATPSLRGYLSDHRYVELVTQTLINAVPANFPHQVFRVSSSELNGFAQTENLLRAAEQSFYSGDTDLQVVVDTANVDHLSVIVTDLFQSNLDFSQLGTVIAQKYLHQGYGVGILSLSLDFNGKVYDVGFDQLTFSYEGRRPLYLLLLGPVDAVINYIEKIDIATRDANRLVLSPELFQSPISLQEAITLDSKNMILDLLEGQQGGKKYVINNPRAGEHRVEVGIPYETSPYSLPFETSQFEAVIEKVELTQKDFKTASFADRAVEVEVALSGTSMHLVFKVDPTLMTERGLYRFYFSIRPISVALPSWIEASNMDLGMVASWKKDPSTFDGSQTQYLSSFVDKLKIELLSVAVEPSTLSIFIERPR